MSQYINYESLFSQITLIVSNGVQIYLISLQFKLLSEVYGVLSTVCHVTILAYQWLNEFRETQKANPRDLNTEGVEMFLCMEAQQCHKIFMFRCLFHQIDFHTIMFRLTYDLHSFSSVQKSISLDRKAHMILL